MAKKQDVKKIVLAYSGGLDTSIILKWLKNEYDAEIVTFSADLGQGDELEAVREKALKTGASKVYIDDLKEDIRDLERQVEDNLSTIVDLEEDISDLKETIEEKNKEIESLKQ